MPYFVFHEQPHATFRKYAVIQAHEISERDYKAHRKLREKMDRKATGGKVNYDRIAELTERVEEAKRRWKQESPAKMFVIPPGSRLEKGFGGYLIKNLPREAFEAEMETLSDAIRKHMESR